ncbi:MAG TPA: PH domain-containing protein [Allosphingosinicella sp.]|nr:PH domain-containing protein [Allosphingosinicella sp.]
MTPLDPAFFRLLRLNGAIAGAILIAAAFVVEAILGGRLGLPRGTLAAPAVLAALYLVVLSPARRYRAWGYEMGVEELHVRRGVWTRIYTIVPLGRVQHIDVSQGPLERSLGLSRLVLHTAGTLHSQVVLPGLWRETAEAMRDEIRGRIAPGEE